MAENDRVITIPSSVGGVLYLDLDQRFLYEIPPFVAFGDCDMLHSRDGSGSAESRYLTDMSW